MAKKLKIGDVAEIKTPAGLAYAQYTHDGKGLGELVRVLPGLHSSRPNLDLLVQERELYFTFYTLRYAVRGGQVEVLGNKPVPACARAESLMRHEAGRTREGKVTGWRIIPALHPLTMDFLVQTPIVRELTPEQRKLSIRCLWPPPVMVRELERGWTPERAEDLEEQDRARACARRAQGTVSRQADQAMRHYLYFPRKRDAQAAGKKLLDQGFEVQIRKGADGETWLALAISDVPTTDEQMDGLRDEMESLAAQCGGEYDGWESAMGTLGSEHSDKVN